MNEVLDSRTARERKVVAEIGVDQCRRSAEVVAIDDAARTVELAFSSEVDVMRSFGIEVLSHAAGACDLSRLNDGGALLEDHDHTKQRGVVERAWIGGDRKGRALVRFGKSPAADELFRDVVDGIRRNVSVGYRIHDVVESGSRGGVEVYTVTRWQPYEISIVAVPADVTVGVGRSAGAGHTPKDTDRMGGSITLASRLARAIEDSATPRGVFHVPHGLEHDPERYGRYLTKPKAEALLWPELRSDSLRASFGARGELTRAEGGNVGAIRSLAASIIHASRVARAGANVIVCKDSDEVAVQDGGMILVKRPSEFKTVEPMEFGRIPQTVVGDSFDTTPSGLVDHEAPAVTRVSKGALIDWDSDDVIQIAAHIELSRRDLRDSPMSKLSEELAIQITQGLANEADRVLLAALAAKALTPFSLAKAAARGLNIAELRAIVGSGGHGAALSDAGDLRALVGDTERGGVPAEMCPAVEATIMGAWNRAALAILDDVTIIANRTALNGQTKVTIFASMLPLVPDESTFWTVPA